MPDFTCTKCGRGGYMATDRMDGQDKIFCANCNYPEDNCRCTPINKFKTKKITARYFKLEDKIIIQTKANDDEYGYFFLKELPDEPDNDRIKVIAAVISDKLQITSDGEFRHHWSKFTR